MSLKAFTSCLSLLLLVVFTFEVVRASACPVATARPPGDDDFAELEKVIQDELKETDAPGAAVAVIKDGRVIFSKGFGVASVEAGGAVTPDTLFRLGSTTKMFTGAAMVTLA
jgi:putative ATP-binding cassette transporter